jgi:hypothetical protein
VIVVTSIFVDLDVDVDVVELLWEVVLFDAVISFDEVVSFGEVSPAVCLVTAITPQLERQPSSGLQKADEVPH